MSFVPAPQQASAARNSNAVGNNQASASAAKDAKMASDGQEVPPESDTFANRTFDVYWVDKDSLMYKDGIAKTFDKVSRKATIAVKRKSSIPLILRDMAPPKGSIFNPATQWEKEKEAKKADDANIAAESADTKKKSKGGGKKAAKNKQGGGQSAADIMALNAAEKDKKDHQRDLQKLSNLKSLITLQQAKCETTSGKIHRMLKMLHLAVCDLKQGAVNSSEAEVLDILWALEELKSFKSAEVDIAKEKSIKKEEKAEKKESKKESKKEKKSKNKDSDKNKTKDAFTLSPEASVLKQLLKEQGDNRGTFKDSLKYARKLLSGKEDLITFQLTVMADRLPPLSKYNRVFKLENWQCEILDCIDKKTSAVVCAPTSSGKTLLSTYTCNKAEGTVLFVLPSEVLVWQIAATYYEFFHGNVTICTDQITFQEITGSAQVYIGTPRALEKSLTKSRGAAGQEMVKGEREFMILDGGFRQFDYCVLDEVHTLNGPEGDALQRIMKAVTCPVLALSATIGNATMLQAWMQKVRNEHIAVIAKEVEDGIGGEERDKDEVVLKEHFARFINLQRYVVTESTGKDGKKKQKLLKLHPIAAMTPERLVEKPDLILALSMTPTDMVELWKRIRSIFPSTALEADDDPDVFFEKLNGSNKRISLMQTKEYENHLKKRLTILSQSHADLYERLRVSHLPPPLESRKNIDDQLYGIVQQLKKADLLPAVAFQLDTYGAFHMFKMLLQRLETEQVAEFPDYRKDLIKLARDKAAMRKVAAGNGSRENAADAEEDAKSGFTDELLVSEDTTKPHDKYVLTPAIKRMGYNEVEDIISDMRKAGEKVGIDHALIRGLRRGIAIYTNEVGFSCYRRQVQMLAQKGRIAVVFSDSALAYGVNMPFRSCVFCGDMGDALSPLIAQQMQGRAGRRGMDVQGNIIYVGMEWPYIENLMLGQISKVTGKEPRYPIMALQRALAASNDPEDDNFIHDDETKGNSSFANAIIKHDRETHCHPTVTEGRMKLIAGSTLGDFCEEKNDDSYLSTSQNIIQELGYVNNDMTLAMDHNVLTMIWELHDELPVAINLGAALEQFYIRFCYNKTKSFKESDSTQNDFLSVLLHIVDRVAVREGEESLQQLLRLCPSEDGRTLNEDAIALWLETETTLIKQQDIVSELDIDESEKMKMQLSIAPGVGGDLGPALDKSVYEMLTTKQKGFLPDQPLERRNEIKERIVRIGDICLLVHDNIQQPHSKYTALEVHFRRMFTNIKYSVADMMNQLTDHDDMTEV